MGFVLPMATGLMMNRLIVVSNRIGNLKSQGEASSGGLAVAMAAALRDSGGIWFGWSGQTVARPDTAARITGYGDAATATIDLDARSVDEYYNGFANRTLWPLCHYRIDLAAYERRFDAAYAEVNASFARALAPLLRPDDVIWVHDYHLIPLGRALRALGVTNRIGFFLHIPWPVREVLTALPRHHKLVEALFDYDVVGFQSASALDAFHGYAETELKATVDRTTGRIATADCELLAKVYPIGIDADEMRQLVTTPAARRACDSMSEATTGQQMMLGVDRIDYSKGLPEKFDAYGQFLGDNPDRLGKVFLLQIGQPSRTEVADYRDLGAALQEQAGALNGTFGTLDWSPLRYRTQSMSRAVLAGAYRAARVALVTPLRDGMNLVAKEYVAAQDPDDPGVLILSRFAGAAEQMGEALLVNPYSREDVAETIRRALDMTRAERIVRWKALNAGLARYDLHTWRDAFLTDLAAAPAPRTGGDDASWAAATVA
jgi:trehalose 6-phosphate synthase